jgi:predicted transcriptional regulator
MGKYKENPKYNVLSIRVTDEEKALMDEIQRQTQKSMTVLIREAIQHYTCHLEVSCH